MNINLHGAIAKEDLGDFPLGNAPTLWEQIEGSSAILSRHEDTRPIGPPVLVPLVFEEYPIVWQVWFPVADPRGEDGQFVYVDVDGQVIYVDYLPTAIDLQREET